MIAPKIIYEDTDLLVVYKPAGMAVQTKSLRQMDLETYLKNYLARKNNGKRLELFVNHRLDQPVEGILVFALNKETAAALDRQVQANAKGEKPMKKEYLAAVQGIPSGEKGELVDFLKKDGKTNTSFVVSSKDKDGKKAKLEYEILSTDPAAGTAILKILLHTGRHHQIRVQLSNAGHPIIGDDKYSKEEGKRRSALALCAWRLTFRHPKTGRILTFSCEPASELLRDVVDKR